jgi:hypothetical protein
MDYHPGVFVLRLRDVIAAWVVLAVIAVTAIIVDPGASADAAIAEAQAGRHAPAAVPHNALCSTNKALIHHQG